MTCKYFSFNPKDQTSACVIGINISLLILGLFLSVFLEKGPISIGISAGLLALYIIIAAVLVATVKR